ncbi:hypothetical protein K6U06_17970 [Acidiferrimicrobium sp. IK]|uniref:hypothetical protein n=1 Tax=Acidiferrimicrobium sp. IK TaxID=2871700 RepID=UPI0021CB28AA|nr:hypothetical protein [Acidiferrimicrobium sp. IK]MCU4186258.1 hypothetical protein [Acidiferrimicrobium sp. IK]
MPVPEALLDGSGAQTPTWDEPRWQRILDRIEVRLDGIGLRFWGPPLWLEVTMSGPDSDRWASGQPDGDRSWDWQSSAPCAAAGTLETAGATDDEMLGAASRYTLENLILNAAHEVGEWLRFDAVRVASPHDGVGDGVQGNGKAVVHVGFDPAPETVAGSRLPAIPAVADAARRVASWRFTSLPGEVIGYATAGPTLQLPGAAAAVWTGRWAAVAALPPGAESDLRALRAAVQADVHAMLIAYEAAKVCDAFYVDGSRPWRLAPGSGDPAASVGPGDAAGPDRRPLSVAVSWSPER